MITVRKDSERGRSRFDWLDSRHTFSFGDYHDPRAMGFRALRVINEDRVAPGGGFPPHPHRDMEIITYILDGALEHHDSMGNGSVIRPGDVQRMSAGSGVVHSEYNGSKSAPVHLLQIWIQPNGRVPPSYEQRAIPRERGKLQLIAAQAGSGGLVALHQDAKLYAALLDPGDRALHEIANGRHAWLQVARGAVRVNGIALGAGDGAAISDEQRVELTADGPSEILLFDLA